MLVNIALRTFIVLGHKAAISPHFTLNDLAGSGGRLDILCRCINSAFMLSHGIRTGVRVYLLLQNHVSLRFEGGSLKYLNPDERSTGALIQKALKNRKKIKEGEELESTPGIYVSNSTLKEVLERVEETGLKIYILHERGRDIRKARIPEEVAFVLSDHLDFTGREEKLLAGYQKLKVGPKILHADHTITVVQNELDRIFN